MKRTAFVTGGTGFIGSNLIKLLIEQNWQVTALHRELSDRSALKDLPVKWVKGSITEPETISNSIPTNTEVVFHLAGDTNLWSKRNKRQTAVNIDGTKNMVKAACRSKVSVFIHTSSVAAWGNVKGRVTEQTPQRGNRSWINYAYTKWAGERQALAGLESGMKVVILNPSNVIGPHDAKNWGRLMIAVCKNNLPVISNGCISITHVDEVVRAHINAVETGKSGERYILAGKKKTFYDFIKVIAEAADSKNHPFVIPDSIFRGYGKILSFKSLFFNGKPKITPELAKIMTRKDVSYSSQKAIDELDYSIRPDRISVQDCYNWLQQERLI